jgi:hypothetical protein
MGGVDPRTLVAQALACLPTMAQADVCVGILSWTMPRLYARHIRGKDARVLPRFTHRPGLSP